MKTLINDVDVPMFETTIWPKITDIWKNGFQRDQFCWRITSEVKTDNLLKIMIEDFRIHVVWVEDLLWWKTTDIFELN